MAKAGTAPGTLPPHLGQTAPDAIRAPQHGRSMDTPSHDTSRLHGLFTALREDLSTQIVGQSALVERLLIALLADGHLLVEGAPGLAKTTALRADRKSVGSGKSV